MHTERQAADPITHIFEAWDAALGAKDSDASMALYQPDATLESPLVRHLLGTASPPSARNRRGHRARAGAPARVRGPGIRQRVAASFGGLADRSLTGLGKPTPKQTQIFMHKNWWGLKVAPRANRIRARRRRVVVLVPAEQLLKHAAPRARKPVLSPHCYSERC